jgi:prevent-host-death family protein
MTVVNVHEAKTSLSRLIEQALRGEDVVIARNGVPAVRLVQVEPVKKGAAKRRPGLWAGKIKEIDPDWWKPDNDLTDHFEVYSDADEGKSGR